MSIIPREPDLQMYYIDLVENKEIKSKPNSIKDSKNNSYIGENDNYNNDINNNGINYNTANNFLNNMNNNKMNIYDEENSKINNTSISNSTYFISGSNIKSKLYYRIYF